MSITEAEREKVLLYGDAGAVHVLVDTMMRMDGADGGVPTTDVEELARVVLAACKEKLEGRIIAHTQMAMIRCFAGVLASTLLDLDGRPGARDMAGRAMCVIFARMMAWAVSALDDIEPAEGEEAAT